MERIKLYHNTKSNEAVFEFWFIFSHIFADYFADILNIKSKFLFF